MTRTPEQKIAVLTACVQHFAADIAELEHDVVVYRELAQAAMQQNAALVKETDVLRQQIAERREEIRRYTAARVQVEA